jgi:SAM-dependent methyltransferase
MRLGCGLAGGWTGRWGSGYKPQSDPKSEREKMLKELSDSDWFDAQFEWEDVRKKYGVPLPSLPSDEVQIQFTSMAGRQNLLQAFGFYDVARKYIAGVGQPRILDFGCGWGRISRFFLRETAPANLYLADAMDSAIQCLRSTDNPCNVIYNQKRPPIKGIAPESLDLVYAYSVFSHLSEEYFRLWIDYFFHILKPGGHIVFTTRGWIFIEHLQRLRDRRDDHPPNMQEYVQRLCEEMPTPVRIARRYSEGEFQWFTMGGSLELTSDFWGEAFIPKSYLEKVFGSRLVLFTEDIEHVDQSIVVIKKPSATDDPRYG